VPKVSNLNGRSFRCINSFAINANLHLRERYSASPRRIARSASKRGSKREWAIRFGICSKHLCDAIRHSRGRHLDRSAMFGRVRRSFEARAIRNSRQDRSIMSRCTNARIDSLDHDRRILEARDRSNKFPSAKYSRSNRSTGIRSARDFARDRECSQACCVKCAAKRAERSVHEDMDLRIRQVSFSIGNPSPQIGVSDRDNDYASFRLTSKTPK